jgi:hypothetical protein
MQRGIQMKELLASKVFSVVFDFDQWPGNHNDDEECIRPYNGSFFDIRHSYKKVFPDFVPMDEQEEEEEGKESDETQKVSKIKYSINLLGQVSMHIKISSDGKIEYVNEDVSLMSLCGETDELEIFNTESLQQVIKFKWDKYGRNHHLFGCIMHHFYTIIMIIYVKNSYLIENENQVIYAIMIAIGVLYPWLYDLI